MFTIVPVMARVPLPQLSRYWLRCQLYPPTYLRHRPTASHTTRYYYDGPARRFLVSTTSGPAETASSAASGSTIAQKKAPLIKQLREKAKAQRATGKKGNAELQTVPGWELTVGIEIHAQLNTRHKLFSAVTTPLSSDEPNTHVSLFDLAIPGSQPVVQTEALIPAVRAALALNCKVQRVSRWDRKHYFWWDQPNGYQITQFYQPFAKGGHLTLYARDGIAGEDGEQISIGIQQIQMEQDTGKTLAGPDANQWIDFNRVGMPLIEIITKPEIHHPKTAAAFVRKVQSYLSAVDACVSGMEAGGLRADVNVSVRRTNESGTGIGPLGQRTEIKNLSSFKAVEDAIIAERDRQISVLEQGGTVLGETRGWTIGGTETTRLRGKEGEVDYRYMPDPDLAPLVINDAVVLKLKAELGCLPDAEFDWLLTQWRLKETDVMTLMQSEKLEYYYKVLEALGETSGSDKVTGDCAPLASNWVLHDLGRLTSERNSSASGAVEALDITPAGDSSRVPASHLAEIIYFLHKNKISKQVAKELLFSVFRGDLTKSSLDGYSSVRDAIDGEDLWLRQLSESEHADMAEEILAEEDHTLEKFFRPHFSQQKAYPQGHLMRLVGKMMKTGPLGQVDPQVSTLVLRRAIEARFEESSGSPGQS